MKFDENTISSNFIEFHHFIKFHQVSFFLYSPDFFSQTFPGFPVPFFFMGAPKMFEKIHHSWPRVLGNASL